jgi:hypothetical protein
MNRKEKHFCKICGFPARRGFEKPNDMCYYCNKRSKAIETRQAKNRTTLQLPMFQEGGNNADTQQ